MFSMDDYDTIVNELNVVRRKLESKVEALTILNQELKQCQSERDKFKSIAQHSRHHACSFIADEKSINHTIASLRENNKCLSKEVEELRLKINESRGDVKLLREQLAKQRIVISGDGVNNSTLSQDREELISTLESLKTKYAMLERDLQMVLDEKEELVSERDAYKNKVERLNHQLNHLLKGDDKRIVDVDTILMENRYLQERLKQIQEEKSLYLQTLSKYKHMLERRRNHGNLKIGANNNSAVIITHKQVQKMLQTTNLSQLPTTQATIADLRSLSLALFESLNDKNTALNHQRKTNKILGSRLNELESKLKDIEINLWNDDQQPNYAPLMDYSAGDKTGDADDLNETPRDESLNEHSISRENDADANSFKNGLDSISLGVATIPIITTTIVDDLPNSRESKHNFKSVGDEIVTSPTENGNESHPQRISKNTITIKERTVERLEDETNGSESVVIREIIEDDGDKILNEDYDDCGEGDNDDDLPPALLRLVEEALKNLNKGSG